MIIQVKLLQLLEYIIMYSIYNSSGQLLGGRHCRIPLPAPNPDCIGEPTHSGHKRLTIFKNPWSRRRVGQQESTMYKNSSFAFSIDMLHFADHVYLVGIETAWKYTAAPLPGWQFMSVLCSVVMNDQTSKILTLLL